MVTKTKPELKGEPLVMVPTFGTLASNPFGREIESIVNDQFNGTPAELKRPVNGKPYTHSNLFRMVAVDQAARELDARTIFPEESELLLPQGRLPEADSTYKDLAGVLDFSGRNHDLAVHLYNQLPEQDLDLLPAIIVGLGTERSDVGDYGLVFNVRGYTQLRPAEILQQPSGHFKADDPSLVKNGVPSELGEGKRYLYTRSQGEPSVDNLGLVRLCVGGDRDLDAGVDNLADALDLGRVVLVSGEAGALDTARQVYERGKSELDARVRKLNTQLDAAKQELNTAYEGIVGKLDHQ
jgi:hypothetical protein